MTLNEFRARVSYIRDYNEEDLDALCLEWLEDTLDEYGKPAATVGRDLLKIIRGMLDVPA